jgi:hypothetical protein
VVGELRAMGVEPADVDEVIMTQAHGDHVGPPDEWRADLLPARATSSQVPSVTSGSSAESARCISMPGRLARGIEDPPGAPVVYPRSDPGNATGATADQEAHA